MPNSMVVTVETKEYGFNRGGKMCKVITCVLTANSTAANPENFAFADATWLGQMPEDGIFPGGFLMSIATNPSGVTAPTDSYNLRLISDFGTSLDLLGGKLDGRSSTVTQIVQPVRDNESTPPFVPPGAYTLRMLGNAVDSAITTVQFVMLEGQ